LAAFLGQVVRRNVARIWWGSFADLIALLSAINQLVRQEQQDVGAWMREATRRR